MAKVVYYQSSRCFSNIYSVIYPIRFSVGPIGVVATFVFYARISLGVSGDHLRNVAAYGYVCNYPGRLIDNLNQIAGPSYSLKLFLEWAT
jgi:hypothetical protein